MRLRQRIAVPVVREADDVPAGERHGLKVGARARRRPPSGRGRGDTRDSVDRDERVEADPVVLARRGGAAGAIAARPSRRRAHRGSPAGTRTAAGGTVPGAGSRPRPARARAPRARTPRPRRPASAARRRPPLAIAPSAAAWSISPSASTPSRAARRRSSRGRRRRAPRAGSARAPPGRRGRARPRRTSARAPARRRRAARRRPGTARARRAARDARRGRSARTARPPAIFRDGDAARARAPRRSRRSPRRRARTRRRRRRRGGGGARPPASQPGARPEWSVRTPRGPSGSRARPPSERDQPALRVRAVRVDVDEAALRRCARERARRTAAVRARAARARSGAPPPRCRAPPRRDRAERARARAPRRGSTPRRSGAASCRRGRCATDAPLSSPRARGGSPAPRSCALSGSGRSPDDRLREAERVEHAPRGCRWRSRGCTRPGPSVEFSHSTFRGIASGSRAAHVLAVLGGDRRPEPRLAHGAPHRRRVVAVRVREVARRPARGARRSCRGSPRARGAPTRGRQVREHRVVHGVPADVHAGGVEVAHLVPASSTRASAGEVLLGDPGPRLERVGDRDEVVVRQPRDEPVERRGRPGLRAGAEERLRAPARAPPARRGCRAARARRASRRAGRAGGAGACPA